MNACKHFYAYRNRKFQVFITNTFFYVTVLPEAAILFTLHTRPIGEKNFDTVQQCSSNIPRSFLVVKFYQQPFCFIFPKLTHPIVEAAFMRICKVMLCYRSLK